MAKIIVRILIFGLILNINTVISSQLCDLSRGQTTPSSRFVIFTDEGINIVKDRSTNLMWRRCLEGTYGYNCSLGRPDAMRWREAMELGQGWRLPTRKELLTLVERRCKNPAMNLDVFPEDNSYFLWSSNFFNTRRGGYYAWGVNFKDGEDYLDFQVASNYVRLVKLDN